MLLTKRCERYAVGQRNHSLMLGNALFRYRDSFSLIAAPVVLPNWLRSTEVRAGSSLTSGCRTTAEPDLHPVYLARRPGKPRFRPLTIEDTGTRRTRITWSVQCLSLSFSLSAKGKDDHRMPVTGRRGKQIKWMTIECTTADSYSLSERLVTCVLAQEFFPGSTSSIR